MISQFGRTVFCIFPYVQSEEPVSIRGETLFPLSRIDKARISDDERQHIRTLCQLFYWSNNEAVSNPLWTLLRAPASTRQQMEFADRLSEIRQLLGYLCCVPDIRPEIFRLINNYEHVDYYLFEHSPLRGRKDLLHSIIFDHSTFDSEGYSNECYDHSLNQGTWWNIVPGCRIYPQSKQVSHPWIINQPDGPASLPIINAVGLFRLNALESQAEKRVFKALEWYNRSCQANTTPDMALVSLAIAFETLLGIRRQAQNNTKHSIRERLQTSIQLLLGEVPHLKEWLYQFYSARSSIVHQGEWSQLRFTKENGGKQNEYGYLVHYGWLIFRICVNTFISGRLQVAKIDLESKFSSTQERLQRILKELKDTSADPADTLISLVDDIKKLIDSPGAYFVPLQFDLLHEVGTLLARKLLELRGELSVEERNRINVALETESNSNQQNKQKLVDHLVLILQYAEELPYDKVRQPAIEQLTKDVTLTLEEIKAKVEIILNDSRNKDISATLRRRLSNSAALINYEIYFTKLSVFMQFSEGSHYITKEHLFTLLQGYSYFVKRLVEEFRLEHDLYIMSNNESIPKFSFE